MLYAIGDDDGHIKIGITTSLESRLAALQTSSHLKLRVHQTWELGSRAADKQAETILHWQLARYRTNGEWFLLSPKALDWLLRRIPSDFQDRGAQVAFDDAPTDPKIMRSLRLSNQFLRWLADITPHRSNQTETLERLGALPPAEREVIALMLKGEWTPQQEPHSFGELMNWDKDLKAVLDGHPEIKNRVRNIIYAEQQYLTDDNFMGYPSPPLAGEPPDWMAYHPDSSGPLYDEDVNGVYADEYEYEPAED